MDAKLTLTLSNNDNAIGTLCLADGVGNRNIRLWKFTGNAPSLTDCSQIFGGIGDTFSLTKRRVTIQAVQKRMEVIKEPSLRIVRNAVRAELHASRYAGSVERRNLHLAELSMATYPSLRKQTYESDRQRLDGIVADEGGDGSLWGAADVPGGQVRIHGDARLSTSAKKHAGGFLRGKQRRCRSTSCFAMNHDHVYRCVFVKSPCSTN